MLSWFNLFFHSKLNFGKQFHHLVPEFFFFSEVINCYVPAGIVAGIDWC